MGDEHTTESERLTELIELRQRVAVLEASLAQAEAALQAETAARERLQGQIEERRLYLESVLDNAPDAIVTLDARHNILEWNNGAERLFGYTRDEAIGQNIDYMVNSPGGETFKQATALTQRILGGKPVPPMEAVRYRKDGVPVNVILAGAPIFFEGAVIGVVAVYTDITEFKETQRALRTSEMQYRATLEAMGDGIHVVNADLTITLLNPSLERWAREVGVKGDLVGRSIFDVFAFLPDAVRDEYRQVFETGDTLVTEESIIHDGEETVTETRKIPMFEGQSVSGVVTVIRNITERKHAEREIRRRTAQLEALREVSLDISAELKLDALLQSIVTRAAELMGGNTCTFYSYWPDEDVLAWAVGAGESEEIILTHRRGEGFVGVVWDKNTPLIVDDYASWEGRLHPPASGDYGFKALVGVPVHWSDEFMGVLVVSSQDAGVFASDEAELLEMFATQVATAIYNARLFEMEQKQRRLAEALVEAAATVSTLDLEQVLDRILEQVEQVVAGDAFNVMLIEGDRAYVVRYRGREKTTGQEYEPIVISDYPSLLKMMESGKPVVISDVTVDRGWVAGQVRPWRRAYVAAPIRVGVATVGFLNVSGARVGQFDADDARWLEAFAYHAAIAVQNARLHQETVRRLAQTQVLREAMVVASATLDFDTVLERTCKILSEEMDVDFVGVLLPEPGGKWLSVHPSVVGYASSTGALRVPVGGSICGTVFRTGEPVIIDDVLKEPNYYGPVGDVRSELSVPLRIGNRVIGVLDVENQRPKAFTQDDLAFYAAIAGQLSIALENARLYEEVSRHAGELGELVQRLRELDRLKSEFIQNVSHELRSPLALIRGYAELLDTGELGVVQEEQKTPIAIIARRSRMLSELVRDITLLLEAEVNPPRPEPVRIDDLSQAAVEDFHVIGNQKHLTLEMHVAPNLPPVAGNPTHLRRVLDNLLGNAIKFTPENGRVALGLQQAGNAVVMTVRDTGIGIPGDQLERIFDRFYQVDGSSKRRYGGVGLGLALVKEIVTLYGGSVTVESEVGVGSTFTVTLPAFGTSQT
ncbi:MAG: GAF domain-containing protein [Anaerolineae bacterium]|nr:GAF domain-containing protein [Anaerolineae bacterium]